MGGKFTNQFTVTGNQKYKEKGSTNSVQVTILRKILGNTQESAKIRRNLSSCENVDRNWIYSREFSGKDSPMRNSWNEHSTVSGVWPSLQTFQ